MGTIYLYHCLKELESLIKEGTKNHWIDKPESFTSMFNHLKSFFTQHKDLTYRQRKLLINLICRLDAKKYYYLNPDKKKKDPTIKTETTIILS